MGKSQYANRPDGHELGHVMGIVQACVRCRLAHGGPENHKCAIRGDSESCKSISEVLGKGESIEVSLHEVLQTELGRFLTHSCICYTNLPSNARFNTACRKRVLHTS